MLREQLKKAKPMKSDFLLCTSQSSYPSSVHPPKGYQARLDGRASSAPNGEGGTVAWSYQGIQNHFLSVPWKGREFPRRCVRVRMSLSPPQNMYGDKRCIRCEHRLGDHVPTLEPMVHKSDALRWRICDDCGCRLSSTRWLSYIAGGNDKRWRR